MRLSLGLGIVLIGCETYNLNQMSDAARMRASAEFNCPESQVKMRNRSELSPYTFDVHACGHAARYTCLARDRTCIRESDPPSAAPADSR